MVGKRQKQPGSLAFKRGGRYRALQRIALPGERPVPACPERATGEAREAWERLWESPLSSAIADTDLPALYRWLWWYDQWIVCTKRLAILPVHSEGAKRQLRHLKVCEASLQRLEEAFGMTPLARMRLGITFSEGRSSLARLRASLDVTRDDPREVLREGASSISTGHSSGDRRRTSDEGSRSEKSLDDITSQERAAVEELRPQVSRRESRDD